MDNATRSQLEKRSAKGLYVSFLDDVPEVPSDAAEVYQAFAELRASTPGDEPISFSAKREAFEVFPWEDFEMFIRVIDALDHVYGERQAERMKREIEKSKGGVGRDKGKSNRAHETPEIGRAGRAARVAALKAAEVKSESNDIEK